MDSPRSRSLLDALRAARVARLATHNATGAIDLVPITFALVDSDTLVTAVDHKPKRTARLQRLENIRRNSSVTVLVDHYDDDWSQLWWVRVRGDATIVDDPAPALLDPLIAKYEQYRDQPPSGAAIVIRILDVHEWAAQA